MIFPKQHKQNCLEYYQINMSCNLLPMYRDAVECYTKFENQYHQLAPEEILEGLDICLMSLDKILCAETSENDNICYVNTSLVNLKEQALLNISRIKNICKKSEKCISTKNTMINKNIKFQSMIDNAKIKLKTKGLCDIAGLNNVKDVLRTYIVSPIYQPQLFEGLKYSNCILLFGPPGTGKTRLVDALTAEIGATLLYGTASNILSHYVGQSEKILHSLFQYIYDSNEQTILFIDEVDGLCRQRTQNESDHARRLKTEFLCQISNFEDCRKGFLICATNCPWELDVAFVRRFQKQLYIPLPNNSERYELLKFYTQNTPLRDTINSWEPIINETEGYSGSDIVQLIQHALTIPIVELQQNKVWKLVDNKFYEALSANDNIDGICSIHYDDFKNLPPNTARVRSADMTDLTQAMQEVKRTVSNEYIKQYDVYANNYVKY